MNYRSRVKTFCTQPRLTCIQFCAQFGYVGCKMTSLVGRTRGKNVLPPFLFSSIMVFNYQITLRPLRRLQAVSVGGAPDLQISCWYGRIRLTGLSVKWNALAMMWAAIETLVHIKCGACPSDTFRTSSTLRLENVVESDRKPLLSVRRTLKIVLSKSHIVMSKYKGRGNEWWFRWKQQSKYIKNNREQVFCILQ